MGAVERPRARTSRPTPFRRALPSTADVVQPVLARDEVLRPPQHRSRLHQDQRPRSRRTRARVPERIMALSVRSSANRYGCSVMPGPDGGSSSRSSARVRFRKTGADLPDADLIVFYESEPTDVVDSPTFGRIGPVPYARTGGHVNRGLAILKAADFQPGSMLPSGHVRDLAPTILSLARCFLRPKLPRRSVPEADSHQERSSAST